MLFEIADLYTFMLCFVRCGAMFFWVPLFTGQMVPMLFRVAVAAIVALFAMVYVEISVSDLPYTFIDLIIYMIKEFVVGSFMGVAVRIVFFAVEFTGNIVSQEAGLAMSTTFDPASGSSSTTYGTLLFYFTLLLLMATETHHEMLHAFMLSYEIAPIGRLFPGAGGIQNLILDTSWVFALGLQMAAPIVAIAFVVNLTFAVLGKAAPKINVFITSFGVKIAVSLLFIALTVSLVAQYILYAMNKIPEQMLQYLIP